jgi:hypothetical protein
VVSPNCEILGRMNVNYSSYAGCWRTGPCGRPPSTRGAMGVLAHGHYLGTGRRGPCGRVFPNGHPWEGSALLQGAARGGREVDWRRIDPYRFAQKAVSIRIDPQFFGYLKKQFLWCPCGRVLAHGHYGDMGRGRRVPAVAQKLWRGALQRKMEFQQSGGTATGKARVGQCPGLARIVPDCPGLSGGVFILFFYRVSHPGLCRRVFPHGALWECRCPATIWAGAWRQHATTRGDFIFLCLHTATIRKGKTGIKSIAKEVVRVLILLANKKGTVCYRNNLGRRPESKNQKETP